MLKTTLKTILAGSILVVSSFTFAADIDMNADANDLAIKGYDPVSYFTMSTPKMGNASYTATYKGGIYRFSNEENRDMFKANPAKYAPQYGGYCAYAVSQNSTAGIEPDQFTIVDDKLYLNYNSKIQKKWTENRDEYIRSADKNWPAVID